MKQTSRQYRKILTCVDLSTNSLAILLRSVELANFYQAEMIVLHVNENLPAMSEPFGEPPSLILDPELLETLDQRLQKELDELIKEAGLSELVPIERIDGSPKHVILDYIKEHHIDLATIGHHQDIGFLDALGSTASSIVNKAKCDVMVVKS